MRVQVLCARLKTYLTFENCLPTCNYFCATFFSLIVWSLRLGLGKYYGHWPCHEFTLFLFIFIYYSCIDGSKYSFVHQPATYGYWVRWQYFCLFALKVSTSNEHQMSCALLMTSMHGA